MPTIFKVHYRLYYGRLRLQLLRPFHWTCRITWSSLTYPHLDSGASNGIRTRDSCLASNCITTILYLRMPGLVFLTCISTGIDARNGMGS